MPNFLFTLSIKSLETHNHLTYADWQLFQNKYKKWNTQGIHYNHIHLSEFYIVLITSKRAA